MVKFLKWWASGIALGIVLVLGMGCYLFSQTIKHQSQPAPITQPLLSVRGIWREEQLYYQTVLPATNEVEPVTARAVVIPHHLLAAEMINQALAPLSSPQIKLVVLIAPDHFNQTPPNYAGMITTTGWQTPFGPQPGIAATQFKTQLSSTLPELYLAPENAWQIEHGVYGLVPYVKYYFPQAQLLTLALAPQNKLDVINIGSNLQALAAANFTPAQILLLVSTDFIHHGELATIDDQDARNRELLENFSTDASKQIDNDCPQCWSFALGWFGANTPPFQFLANQNSYDYSGEAQDITSYLTGYF